MAHLPIRFKSPHFLATIQCNRSPLAPAITSPQGPHLSAGCKIPAQGIQQLVTRTHYPINPIIVKITRIMCRHISITMKTGIVILARRREVGLLCQVSKGDSLQERAMYPSINTSLNRVLIYPSRHCLLLMNYAKDRRMMNSGMREKLIWGWCKGWSRRFPAADRETNHFSISSSSFSCFSLPLLGRGNLLQRLF